VEAQVAIRVHFSNSRIRPNGTERSPGIAEQAEHIEHERSLRRCLYHERGRRYGGRDYGARHRPTPRHPRPEQSHDQWNYYQAHKIPQRNGTAADLLRVVTIGDKDAAKKIAKSYADHQAKWNDDSNKSRRKPSLNQGRAGRSPAQPFDLSEALLEIGLVITS